jgi:hypothetical protein
MGKMVDGQWQGGQWSMVDGQWHRANPGKEAV